MSNFNQNPLQHEDELIPILLQNQDFINSSKSALNSYKKNHNLKKSSYNKPTFNLSQFMSYNFSHFTKFSFAGLAVFTLLAGGLSAQALAPENLKPTTLANNLFSTNKQKDNNPQVALKQEPGSVVATLNSCDLNLKYPESMNDTKLSFQKSEDTATSQFGTYSLSIPNYQNEQISMSANRIEISCSTSLDTFQPLINAKIVTVDELRKETGWFISNSNLTNIKLGNVNGNNLTQFKINDKFYQIISSSNTVVANALSNTDIQLQQASSVKQNSTKIITNIAQNGCNSIDITKNQNLTVFSSQSSEYDTVNISNYPIDALPDTIPNSALISILCYNSKGSDVWYKEVAGIKGGILNQYAITKTTKDKIPFISDAFRSTITDKVYTIGLSEKRGQVDYYFETVNGSIYQIGYNNEKVITNTFNLQINLK
jgi:hypothetical protein